MVWASPKSHGIFMKMPKSENSTGVIFGLREAFLNLEYHKLKGALSRRGLGWSKN